MTKKYFQDLEFRKQDYTKQPLAPGEYDGCAFEHCNFSNTNLSGVHFMDCRFTDCNLSTALLGKTAFKDVKFINCKLMGLRFDDCDPFLFEVYFETSSLDLCVFYRCKLKKTIFRNCSLREADFTEADCSGAFFDHCDLDKSVFAATNLEAANLVTAFHYLIDPESNRLKKARFSLGGLPGLLAKYQIEIEQ